MTAAKLSRLPKDRGCHIGMATRTLSPDPWSGIGGAMAVGVVGTVGFWTGAPQRLQNRATSSKLDPHLLQKGMITKVKSEW
jgi:hypothetical protein